MALQHAILAALAYEEPSGYDLSKAFDATVSSYWTATPQQLYRELERMEAAGLVVARLVEQEKRPNKRLFSLTDSGRAALRDFTTRTPKPIAIRDELLVQVEAMELGDPAAIHSHIEEKRVASEEKLGRYRKTQAFLLQQRTEEDYLATSRSIGPYLTLRRGILFEEENIQWCTFVLQVLRNRSSPSRTMPNE
jgi:DNA-binding PadR family transcriptional regulator